jgi:hypothetical protein
MNSPFEKLAWEVVVSPPWRVLDCGHCIEITQPEGVGGLHISSARKKQGSVTLSELAAKMKSDCPEGTELHQARCGDFVGMVADYVDWNADAFWRVWLLARDRDLLHVTYTCRRGEEDLEAEQASRLLKLLRWKG